MMRGRREERRDERQDDRQLGRPGGGGNHYQMRQKMVAIGDDFWIENDHGQKVFKVDGKALRVRQTLVFEDAHGTELCKIQERMMRVKDSMEIEGPHGEQLAMVKKALITPIRERWVVKIKGGSDLEVKGNILDHEYTIGEAATKWPKCPRSGSAYGIPTESRSIPGRMTCSSWPWPCASTRWRTKADDVHPGTVSLEVTVPH